MEIKQHITEWCLTQRRNQQKKKLLEVNDNENTIPQNPWNILKVILKAIYSSVCLYLKNKRENTTDFMMQVKSVEKHEHTTS